MELCFKCDLSLRRTKMVLGVGNGTSGIMIIGEAPGMAEDRRGIPFVGKSGKLLRKIIKAAGFDVDDVFLTNAVKCRPYNNNTPLDSEVADCKYRLNDEILELKDDIFIIITLGNTALKSVLNNPNRISSMRGKSYKVGRIRLFPMFHPAYALRDKLAKDVFLKDWKYLMEYYELVRTYHSNNLDKLSI